MKVKVKNNLIIINKFFCYILKSLILKILNFNIKFLFNEISNLNFLTNKKY